MSEHYKRMRPLLGTFVEIGTLKSDLAGENAIQKAFKVVEEVHRLLSFQDPESELSKLNRSPGKKITLSALTVCALRIARRTTSVTAGRFNFTVGGQMIRIGVLPDHGGPDCLDRGSAADLEIRGHSVRLNKPIRITLDGIAKGLAVDLAIKAMKKSGAKAGWVNAGGDLKVFGELGLTVHRREVDGKVLKLGTIRNLAVATSSVWPVKVTGGSGQSDPRSNKTDARHSFANQPIERDSRFLGVIVAPEGEFLNEGTWTVSAKSAWLADALTKVASLALDNERAEIIERFGGRIISGKRDSQWVH